MHKAVEEEILALKNIPKNKAKNLVYRYIKDNPKILTSDIILGLKLDPDLVLEVLDDLDREGKVRGKDPEPSS